MHQISCIIIEDEPLAQERMKSFTAKLSFLNLLAVFGDAVEAFTYLQQQQVDLIFLDINLGDISGIQLLETSAVKTHVIITTAYQEYALKGYDLNVTDYLLKPFTFERFLQAVNKVEKNISKPGEKAADIVFIKTEYRLEKVHLNDILYIEGLRDYRAIQTIHKKILTLQTFGELESMLPSTRICRVHKSYMAAIDKIDFIEKDRIRIGNMFIPISETYRQSFFNLINK